MIQRLFPVSTLDDLASVSDSSVFVVEAMAPIFGYIFTWQSPIAIVVSCNVWVRGLSIEYCMVIIFIARHNYSSPVYWLMMRELTCLELLRVKGDSRYWLIRRMKIPKSCWLSDLLCSYIILLSIVCPILLLTFCISPFLFVSAKVVELFPTFRNVLW